MTCHLEKELILIDGVWLVSYDINEISVSFCSKHTGCNGVTVVKDDGATAPHVSNVELSSVEASACIYSVDNHSGHIADVTLWIFGNYLVHILKTSLAIAVIQFAKTSNEDKFVNVCSEWESRLAYFSISPYFLVSVAFKGIVCGSIKRVFNVYTITCIFLVERVAEGGSPRTFCKVAFQFIEVYFGGIFVTLPHIKKV